MCFTREDLYTLRDTQNLSDEKLLALLKTSEFDEELHSMADEVRRSYYGNKVYVRGLVEFTNYCKNNCKYCGIQACNANANRYRLTKEEILSCCDSGYELGYRTFVLQGGEDPAFTDEIICDIVSTIKKRYPDCAVTLSIGEKSKESYQKYYDAGADRYLLRHETANETHYKMLHPKDLSLSNRMRCLFDLKEIGYQVGAGFMVGSPYQKLEYIVEDFRFLQKLKPDMIGIGPFIPHKDTIFKEEPHGDLQLTLRILSVLRLLFPYVLLPATTALGTIDPMGRELGMKAGANVCMPNLSPRMVRAKYSLYDNKICTGEEAAECRECLNRRMSSVGYEVVTDRGDVAKNTSNF